MAAYAPPLRELPVDVRLMNGVANTVFALVGAALLVAGVLWLMRLPAFGFKSIRLDGELGRNSVGTIRATAMPQLKGNFFTMDLNRTREAFESVPWVRRAVVSRVWPDTLRVQVEEHRAAAYWQTPEGQDDKLVDVDGSVFEANLGDVEDDDLPELGGPEGSSPHVLQMYQRLQPVFAKLDGAAVAALTMSARGSWSVQLDSGATVELGRGEDVEVVARTERFVRTVGDVTGRYQRPLEAADLRHADGYAVKLRGITTTATPPKTKTR